MGQSPSCKLARNQSDLRYGDVWVGESADRDYLDKETSFDGTSGVGRGTKAQMCDHADVRKVGSG